MTSLGMARSAAAARLIDAIISADEHLDAAAFVTVLTPNGTFRFGGAPAIAGREAVSGMVAALFSRIAQLKHTILASWESDAVLVYEGEVRYTLVDATTLMLPYFNILRLAGSAFATTGSILIPRRWQKRRIGKLLAHSS